MKKNKKLTAALLFCFAFIVTATAAYADITASSGYDILKDAVKTTNTNMSEGFESFTLEKTLSVKDNDKLLETNENMQKVDCVRNITENTASNYNYRGERYESYSYADESGTISRNSGSDIYYISRQSSAAGIKPLIGFSGEEQASDIENIIDALVGNLKEYVIVEDKPDGSRELSVSLNGSRIPPLANAVSSFCIKQYGINLGENLQTASITSNGAFTQYNFSPRTENAQLLPYLTDDIYVKSFTGNAATDKDGILETLLATIVITGNDESGISHDLTFDFLLRLTGINSTTVEKPDLTGKKVEERVEWSSRSNPDSQELKKFIGTYKNDMATTVNGEFVKIGERFLEIESIEGEKIKGRIYDVYREAFASDYKSQKIDISFEAVLASETFAKIEATEPSVNSYVKPKVLYFNIDSASVRLVGSWTVPFDDQFYRVFEN